jgi:hypothetical protein
MKKKVLVLLSVLIGIFMLSGCSSTEKKATEETKVAAPAALEIVTGGEYFIFKSDGTDPDLAFENIDIWGNEWTPSTGAIEEVQEDGMKAIKFTANDAGWFGVAFRANKSKDLTKFATYKLKIKTKMPVITVIFQGRGENKVKKTVADLPDLENGWKLLEVDVPMEVKGSAIALLGEGTKDGDYVIFTDAIFTGK